MVNNSLVKTEGKKTFSNFLMGDAIKKKINETVGGANGQRFITSILSAVSANPTLQECEHNSIISAAFLGEALKLSPSPQLGQFYLTPFNDNKRGCKVAQFQIGYKGYIQLALRSGYYKDIDVFEIREGEYLGRDKTTGKYKFEFIEDDDEREKRPVVGYMAYFEYLNGFTKTLYWSKKKMLKHADKYSQAFSANATTVKTKYGEKTRVSFKDYELGNYDKKDEWLYSSFWYKNFDGMAFKTMLRQLISKWGIMSIEMQTAMEKDMAEIKENGDYEYIETQDQEIVNQEVQTQIEHTSETNENQNLDKKETKTTNYTAQNENINTNDFQEDDDIMNNFFD